MEVLESHSFGGLSNVWGGSALRFLKKDFSEWPISYEELINFYDECEKIMNVTHYNDDISNELKIDNNQKNDSKLKLYSYFIKDFLKKYKMNDNYTMGYSRVALNEKKQAFNTRDYIEKLIN